MNKTFRLKKLPIEHKKSSTLDGKQCFTFACHEKVSCFTKCCCNVNLTLYPYDIVELKNSLELDSSSFLTDFCIAVADDNPFFPTIKLKLLQNERKSCPFLADFGCSVYKQRPSACRTYPLERAISKDRGNKKLTEEYFLVNHPYCLGHQEPVQQNVEQYVRAQKLAIYNQYNDLWGELDAVLRSNPWQGEGRGGPLQQLTFMACYNLDQFRDYVSKNNILASFALSKQQRSAINTSDTELLKFAFQFLLRILTGKSSLLLK